jgi:hypothetical protein
VSDELQKARERVAELESEVEALTTLNRALLASYADVVGEKMKLLGLSDEERAQMGEAARRLVRQLGLEAARRSLDS